MNIPISRSGICSIFRSTQPWVLAVLCASLAVVWGQPSAGLAKATPVTSAVDVVRQWQPQHRVYVKGNVGASSEALDGLERWLATNAPNWVVVLAEHAQGETYTDASGESFHGVEAVNQAMGKGLMNTTAFGQQLDPRTGERNAAFFLLFLKERKLSYYGSDAQDRRGLGEEDWVGNLDRAAIAAMRDGARVVDAAKDTISSINARLGQRIAAEVAAREKTAADELAARARAQEQAKAALANAQAEYNLLEAKSGEFARRFNTLDGDLTRPDLPGLAAELKLAHAAFDQNDSAAALRSAETVRNRAMELVRRIDHYPADQAKIEALEQKLKQHERQSFAGAAASQLRAARESLAAVRHEYQRGDSAYAALLENASRAVSAAGSAVAMAERMADQRRALGLMSLIALGLMAGVVGLVLNRRRLPFKTEARQLYELWEKALSEKAGALFALLDRRATTIGTSSNEAAERFSGETLKLCEQIIREVDELFILSACAGRVLQQANGHVNPENASLRLLNLFRRGPYRRAVALLKDQPIAFRPEEGLELVVRGVRTERDRLIGSVDSYQPFTMTFNELISTFNQHAERALNALDRVETSLLKAPEELQAVQRQVDATRAAEAGLRSPADGLFQLAPVFRDLLPSAQQALSQALATGIQDPVGALQNQGARARQLSDDAMALAALGTHALKNTLPVVRECAAALEKSELKPAWLDADFAEISAAADQAAILALKESVRTQIEALTQALKDLEQRSGRAMDLDNIRRGTAREQISQSTAAVDRERRKLGAALGLPAGEILREPDKDPTGLIARATEQWNASFAALGRGDLDAAQNALDSVQALTAEADSIVAATCDAFAGHAETLKSLQNEVREVAELIPQQAQVLSEIKAGYASSVLALGAGDPAHPNANGTLEDNIQESESHMASVSQLLDQSAIDYREAKLLRSMDLLHQAKGLLDAARHRLWEISEKKSRIENVLAANDRRLEALEKRARECAALAAEPATMKPTLLAFEEAGRALADARTAVKASPGDPFFTAANLTDVETRLAAVADSARCDRDLFEQAGRSVAAAANQTAEASRLAARSDSDNIADSVAIQQAAVDVSTLNSELESLRAQHQSAHGDWVTVDKAAVQLNNRAATVAATLRGELERAQAALATLNNAANSVREAGAWTGGFGVMIMGTPGSDDLSRAHAHLERGEYDLALRLADHARQTADRAVAQAQAELMRRRRAEEERREQERRRREAEEAARQRRSSSFGSSSSSSSSSWGRSGSGTRTSSFKSSSGVRTSSW